MTSTVIIKDFKSKTQKTIKKAIIISQEAGCKEIKDPN
jgi:hypothetical protein